MEIKQKGSFVYHWRKLTVDRRADEKIKRRISEARITFEKMKGLLKIISVKTKKRTLKVWSELLYGCKTWTVSKTVEKRLQAVENLG